MTDSNQKSGRVMGTEAAWQTEDVPERTKVMSYIYKQAKGGRTKEQIFVDVQQYILQNKFKPLEDWDIRNMINFAFRKLGKN